MLKRCDECPLTEEVQFERFCADCQLRDGFFDKVRCMHELGNATYREEEFESAVRAYEAARKHTTDFRMESTFNLTLAFTRLSRYEEALVTIDEVIDHVRGDDDDRNTLSEAVYVKGLIYKYLQRFNDSETWLKEAADAGYEKARLELDRLEEARDLEFAQSEMLKNDPEKRLAYLVGVLSRLDQSTSPQQEASVLVMAGKAATEMGDFEQARQLYTHACRTNLSAETATELAEFVLDYGSEEEEKIAEASLRQALTLEGNHGRAHFCLGRLQYKRGELDRAYRSILTALHANPSDEYVIFETAEIAAEVGNVSYCLALLKRLEGLAGSDTYWIDRAQSLRRGIGVC